MPTPSQSAMPPDTRRSPSGRERGHGATLPVVDPHVRVGGTPPHHGPVTDALAPLRELLDRSGGCHLLRAVHVQRDMPWQCALADVARVQGIARTPGSGGLPNGIVACSALAIGDVDARLDALTSHPNLRGVSLPARAGLPTDLAPLERRDLVLELRADTVPIADVVWLATANPGCRIVLVDESGHAERYRRLGPLDNVVLKLGYRDAPDPRRTHHHLGALVGQAIDAVGHERVMLASGLARAGADRPWHEAWRAFDVATRGIAASRRNALFRTNAARTYRL